MIAHANHWNNEIIKIDYVCFRISEETVDHMYARFNNFSNDLYKIWQDVIKDLMKIYKILIKRINIVNCI